MKIWSVQEWAECFGAPVRWWRDRYPELVERGVLTKVGRRFAGDPKQVSEAILELGEAK